MKYVVHGVSRQIISIDIEAGSASEAMDMVEGGSYSIHDIDVWDTDYEWHIAYENE